MKLIHAMAVMPLPIDLSMEPEVENLNPEGGEPPLTGPPINYLLYGYNVLKYGYMDASKAKTTAAIFDESKVKEKKEVGDGGHYTKTSHPSSDSSYLYSKSASSLFHQFDASASAKYKGVFFSGNIQAEYKLSMAMSEEQVLIKYIQHHTTEMQAYTADVTTLKTLLSKDFKDKVEKYASNKSSLDYNPGKILDDYGTHAILQYYLGGTSQINSVFTNHTKATEEDIQVSARATYRRYSGSASAEDQTKSKLVYEHSNTYFSSVGGNNILDAKPEEVAKQYPAWVESIKTAPVFCGIAGIDSSLLPIWELFDGDTAKNLEDAFIEAAKTAQTEPSRLDGVPYYITDIGVYSREEWQDAHDQKLKGYTWVMINPGTDNINLVEANKGAGGNYIYLAYKLSPDRSKAITDIQIIAGDTSKVAPADGYTKISVDLNEGAGGKFIYLTYKRITQDEINRDNTETDEKNKTKCLKEIRGVYGESYSPPEYWEWARARETANLNAGCKSGAEVVRLVVHKAP